MRWPSRYGLLNQPARTRTTGRRHRCTSPFFPKSPGADRVLRDTTCLGVRPWRKVEDTPPRRHARSPRGPSGGQPSNIGKCCEKESRLLTFAFSQCHTPPDVRFRVPSRNRSRPLTSSGMPCRAALVIAPFLWCSRAALLCLRAWALPSHAGKVLGPRGQRTASRCAPMREGNPT